MLDSIKAERFYQDAGDKIKLNWLCYEYANHLFTAIKESEELTQYRRSQTPEEITEFCLYFAKRLRKSVFDQNAGKSYGTVFDPKYVYEFYPENSVNRTPLLDAALSAWEGQILACENCPNHCLSECFDLTDMFDSLKSTD